MSKYRGLIIDDSKGVRTTVTAMLQILGHDSDAVASVEEGRKLLSAKNYDYLLLDMEIPMTDGGEADTAIGPSFLLEIRRTYRKEVFPVIVITGRMLDKAEFSASLLWNGANDFIPKPFPLSGHTLEASILRFLEEAERYKSSHPQLPPMPVNAAAWLTRNHTEKQNVWTAIGKNGTPHTIVLKRGGKQDLLLECIFKYYRNSPNVPHGEIMDACHWNDKDYFPVYSGRRCPKRGISRSQFSILKKTLGIDYEHIDIGVVFKQPED